MSLRKPMSRQAAQTAFTICRALTRSSAFGQSVWCEPLASNASAQLVLTPSTDAKCTSDSFHGVQLRVFQDARSVRPGKVNLGPDPGRLPLPKPHGSGSAQCMLAAGMTVAAVAAAGSLSAAAKEPTEKAKPKEVVLYQYDSCPFCNKVKAFLDFYDIPYRVVEVNPLSRQEIKWTQQKKVPVLVVDGETMLDSSTIISALHRRLNPAKGQAVRLKVDAGQEAGGEEETLSEEDTWRKWVDDHLVHVLSPNIYRTPSEAMEAFHYFTQVGDFSSWERLTVRYVGASAMFFIGKRLKKKHGITDERASLYQAADEWVEALKGRPFLGGQKPNLADLAVFGVLRPIRPLAAGRDMIANSRIGPWYERMEREVGASTRIVEGK